MISPEVLRRFALFAGLEPAAFKEIAMLGEQVAFKQGEWLFREGEEARALYLVISGKVELTINLDEKGERVFDMTTLVEGGVAGWSALLEPFIYSVGARAATDTVLVQIDGAGLLDLMEADLTLGYRVMTHLAQAISSQLGDLRVQFVSMVDR